MGKRGVSDGEDLLLGDWHTTAACQFPEPGTPCLFLFCFSSLPRLPSTPSTPHAVSQTLYPAPPSHQFTCLALLIAEVQIIKQRENTQNRANGRGFYNTLLLPTKNLVISFSTVSILKKKTLTAVECCSKRKMLLWGKVKVDPLFLMCQLV